jgi:hypothetical protein
MPHETTSVLSFRKRLGPVSRLYHGFLAATAILVFGPVLYILLHQWSDLGDGLFRWILVATVLGGPPLAWFLSKVVLSAFELHAVPRPQGPIGDRLWRAALGDPHAIADLQSTREHLRTVVADATAPDEATCANCRGVYTYTLEAGERLLTELRPPYIVPINGTLEDKQRILARLETEVLTWRADYEWFESCLDRLGR